MSRTKRKDPIDIEPKTPDFVMLGETVSMTPTEREIWRAHRDKKKSSKPGTNAKIYLHKGRKAKPKAALKTAKDYDDMSLPLDKTSDVWKYN